MGGLNAEGQQQQLDVSEPMFFQYLNSLLQEAEAESGAPDLELRSKIEALRLETQRVPSASPSGISEVEVAGKLDELEAKMASVDKLLKEVESDPNARSFLSSSADLWMPVITATAEERRATTSSSTSTSTPTPSSTTPAENKDINGDALNSKSSELTARHAILPSKHHPQGQSPESNSETLRTHSTA